MYDFDKDGNEIITRIAKLLADTQIRMDVGMKAAETVREKFTLEKMLNDYTSLWRHTWEENKNCSAQELTQKRLESLKNIG